MIKPEDIIISHQKKLWGTLYEARLEVAATFFVESDICQPLPQSVVEYRLRKEIYKQIYGDIYQRAVEALGFARVSAINNRPRDSFHGMSWRPEDDETYQRIERLIGCIPDPNRFADYKDLTHTVSDTVATNPGEKVTVISDGSQWIVDTK